AGAFCDIVLALLMPKLDGLPDRMHSLDATVLDVGTGSGQTAIELCRRLPDVRVVGLEPAPAPLALAKANVAEAGFGDRIELREQRVEAIAGRELFDFAWLPPAYMPNEVLRAGLASVHSALRPGGWVLLYVVDVASGAL